MNSLPQTSRKRKILTCKPAADPTDSDENYVPRVEAKFMVWHEGGDMPKRFYDEPKRPCFHAQELSRLHPGKRFHVLRTWRAFETGEETGGE